MEGAASSQFPGIERIETILVDLPRDELIPKIRRRDDGQGSYEISFDFVLLHATRDAETQARSRPRVEAA